MTRFTTTKSLLLSAALIAGGATFASADTQLRAQVADQLSTYSMNVDVDSLTDEQVAELHLITTSTMVEVRKARADRKRSERVEHRTRSVGRLCDRRGSAAQLDGACA